MWGLLDHCIVIIDDLPAVYLKKGDTESKGKTEKEAEEFEEEIKAVIENAEGILKEHVSAPIPIMSKPPELVVPPEEFTTFISTRHRLSPLTVPQFNGDKSKFEDFWSLFSSLVDAGVEPTYVKMARLRQCLSGTALEAIRGLGVTTEEYEEAKEILMNKFGGERRKLQAYLDELEAMKNLSNDDVQTFEKFADLVRIAVVKLKAEGQDGELGGGALHKLLVKKLADRQVESYSRWLRENKEERSVLSLRDWLKEEVKIEVEAAEMVHGVEAKQERGAVYKKGERNFKPRTFFGSGTVTNQAGETKPPCSFCEGNHGVWYCKRFKDLSVNMRWEHAKENRLCFRCLGGNHSGKNCKRSRLCEIDGCKKNHHSLLHDPSRGTDSERSEMPREGAVTYANTVNRRQEAQRESFSLRSLPVWVKANGKKLKVNAILDDGSNETFLTEDVAGVLGIQEKYETVRVNVLNNEVETFQSIPMKVTIESVDGQFSKLIDVKTCPQKVTGNYRVEDCNQSKGKWTHLKECNFGKPAGDGLVDLLVLCGLCGAALL